MGREGVGDKACSVERTSCSKRYIFIISADRKSRVHAAENAGQRLNEVLREGTFNWVQRHSCLPQQGRVQTVRKNELGGCGACAEGSSQKQSIHIWGEAHIWTFEMASSCIYIEAEHQTSGRETSMDSKAWAANTSFPPP